MAGKFGPFLSRAKYQTATSAYFSAISGAGGSTLPSKYQDLIDDAVLALQAASIFTLFDGIYLPIFNEDIGNSFNLVNTANFRITWHGTVTKAFGSIASDGTTGYGDPGMLATTLTNWQRDSASMWAHSGVTVNSSTPAIGTDAAVTSDIRFVVHAAGSVMSAIINDITTITSPANNIKTLGGVSRLSTPRRDIYRNGVSVVNDAQASLLISANHILFMKDKTSFSAATLTYSLFAIGAGLTSAQAAAFYAAFAPLMKALGVL